MGEPAIKKALTVLATFVFLTLRSFMHSDIMQEFF